MKKIALLLIAGLLAPLPALGQQAAYHGEAAKGLALAQRWCSDCHLLKGEKQAVQGIPTFRELARDPDKTPDYLRAFLARPHEPMPPLELDRRQIEDILAYIETLKAR